MNFQNIAKIEKYDFYLDLAFRRAREKAESVRKDYSKKKDRFRSKRDPKKYLIPIKETEKRRIDVVSDVLTDKFTKILHSFPNFDGVSPFYIELIKLTTDFGQLKKSLAAMKWVNEKIRFFSGEYKKKIDRATSEQRIKAERGAYYGRISSFVKQIKSNLQTLDDVRKTLKRLPDVKDGLRTVVITGFPNVGKTTILFKLSGSDPEINNYPFTTKSLNIGYFELDGEKIQLIDTPGSFNRIDKMNSIERQAYVSQKYLADLVVYVFDLTEQYPLEDQIDLYKKTPFKKALTFFSKADIIDKKKIDDFCNENEFIAITDIEELKKKLTKS